jgi:hypothetical protein
MFSNEDKREIVSEHSHYLIATGSRWGKIPRRQFVCHNGCNNWEINCMVHLQLSSERCGSGIRQKETNSPHGDNATRRHFAVRRTSDITKILIF